MHSIELIETCRWLSSLARLDYQAIAARSEEAETPLERYLVARATIVLGDYARARQLIDTWRTPDDDAWLEFLSIQADLFERRSLDLALSRLVALRPRFPVHDYLLAELNFITGYLLNTRDQYKAAIPYHQKAIELYRTAKLQGAEAMALFNLCVAFNHLNERELFDFTYHRLELIFEEDGRSAEPLPSLQHLFLRMRAYRKLDHDDYEAALADCEAALAVCLAGERWRDVGGLLSIMAYALVKLGAHDATGDLRARYPLAFPHVGDPHATLLAEIERTAEIAFVTAAEAKAITARWRRSVLDGVHLLFLYDLLLARIANSQDYELLAAMAQKARSLSLKKQQALSLVDFRYYECLALLKTGQDERAKLLLHAYGHDAFAAHANGKIAKYRQLEKAMAATCQLTSCEQTPPRQNEARCFLDSLQHVLTVGTKTIDLSSKPVVERLIQCLMAHAPEPVPIETAFDAVYENAYHPVNHERRLHSLISRVRATVGYSGFLLRRGGYLSIDPCLSLQYVGHSASQHHVEKRRGRLIKVLARAPTPLSITDLEANFDESRRTLQLDLNYLLRARMIRASGATRNRRYHLTRGS